MGEGATDCASRCVEAHFGVVFRRCMWGCLYVICVWAGMYAWRLCLGGFSVCDLSVVEGGSARVWLLFVCRVGLC